MKTRHPSRRQLLGQGAAGLLASQLGGCQRPEAQLTDSGVLPEPGQIDHVIIVMMENRSFDHYLGSLSLLEGWVDLDGLRGDEFNLDASGDPHGVYHLDLDCQSDPPHGWSDCHAQFNEGLNDGFVLEHQARVGLDEAGEVMGYYTRDDLPVHYALAEAYALPQAYYCSLLAPTWPNRIYAQTGTSEGMTSNDLDRAPFYMKTVYKALEEVGEDWQYVYTDIPFLGLFDDHWDSDRISFIEDFLRELERGDLPALTWVDPGFSYNDDHPPHHIGLGQLFLGMIYESLARSPAWDRSLLIITYDEHGGFYDHVPPPKVADELASEGFDQLGFRIPALIVGPWVKTGIIDETLEHCSVLKYVCERFGIEPWTERIAGANSLSVALDEERMASGLPLEPVTLPSFEVPEESLKEECFGYRSGQPELEDWVQRLLPGSDRQAQLPLIHDRLMDRARALGLLRDQTTE